MFEVMNKPPGSLDPCVHNFCGFPHLAVFEFSPVLGHIGGTIERDGECIEKILKKAQLGSLMSSFP